MIERVFLWGFLGGGVVFGVLSWEVAVGGSLGSCRCLGFSAPTCNDTHILYLKFFWFKSACPYWRAASWTLLVSKVEIMMD